MPPRLPQYIEPARLAEASESVTGRLDLEGMQRLRAVLCEPRAEIAFSLHFQKDERGFIIIRGEFATDLVLRCQRCLEPLPVRLEKTIGIGWATDTAGLEAVPEDLEPTLAKEPRVALRDLIEEEVLLGLPMAPAHAEEECPASVLLQELKAHKDKPFAVLKNMKLKKH
ncbi:MAG: YceD family protein [Gammaproteobacteria bacterium]|jgi:uncharacterized protein